MNIVNKIYYLTNIRIEDVLNEFTNFYSTYYSEIVQYYTVFSQTYPKKAFTELKNLKDNIKTLISKLTINRSLFNTMDFWDIFEQIDEINTKLEEIDAYPRLYRVGFIKRESETDYDIYVTKQNETIDQIGDRLSKSPIDIMLDNNIRTEDYTNNGGVKLILKTTNNYESENKLNKLESVYDILTGNNLLGKDIPIFFDFEEDNDEENMQDLLVCTPQQTFKQSVLIICSINKGSIPEYPSIGIDKALIANSTYADGTLFPILLKQLMEIVDIDDTICSFTVEDIKRDNDSYFANVSVKNYLGDNLQYMINLDGDN